jgi:hypothetical protein
MFINAIPLLLPRDNVITSSSSNSNSNSNMSNEYKTDAEPETYNQFQPDDSDAIKTRIQTHRLQQLQTENVRWMIYATRAFFVLFVVSCGIEVLRISADDRAVYLHAIHNPPEGCVPTEPANTNDTTGWSWDMLYKPVSIPASWVYTTFFEAPIKSDCVEFYRRTNPMLLYLPKFPQAMANVAANFFLAPFVIFMDKLGDALRHFMDKFNVAERIFGVILLVAVMLLATVMFGFIVWSGRSMVPTPPSHLLLTQNPKQQQQQQRLFLKSPRLVPRSARRQPEHAKSI